MSISGERVFLALLLIVAGAALVATAAFDGWRVAVMAAVGGAFVAVGVVGVNVDTGEGG